MSNPGVDFSHECLRCGHALEDHLDWYLCDKCGRPIGGCPKCWWFGFLDRTDFPQRCDCDDCEQVGNGTSDKETSRRLSESISREVRVQREMEARSGPFYELAKERSRIMQAAWRAAGSPRRVSRVHTPDGLKYAVIYKSGAIEFVSEEEWDSWWAWRGERYRLYNELRKDYLRCAFGEDDHD